ncbi:MAG: SRPBCC domain-containing protein, partial [Pseudolabrys sp.]
MPHDGLISSGNETVLNFVGEITVAAPREAVFKALSDAPFFASCIEGVRELTAIDATHYDAVLE